MTAAPVAELVEHVTHFQHRVIQDAITDATAYYWRRRAETFEWAMSKPGDYHGQSTAEERAKRDAGLQAAADACRARAHVALLREPA